MHESFEVIFVKNSKEQYLLGGIKTSASSTRFWSVLVVGFLLRGVGNSILTLRRTGSQAIEPPTVLSIVNVVFKKQLKKQTNKQKNQDSRKVRTDQLKSHYSAMVTFG